MILLDSLIFEVFAHEIAVDELWPIARGDTEGWGWDLSPTNKATCLHVSRFSVLSLASNVTFYNKTDGASKFNGWVFVSPKQHQFDACCASGRYGQQDPDEPAAAGTPSSKSTPHMSRKDILTLESMGYPTNSAIERVIMRGFGFLAGTFHVFTTVYDVWFSCIIVKHMVKAKLGEIFHLLHD